eukprot:TRINITY_DN2540_c0_g1_i1.p1 TRINITY_DN2540_c0_g1~~TRINITY_DN2540_c0_g1_i1.p1  ORF type:complete len:229 (+),score=36.72 TRINITY_DN2540_c0_g1_i1:39-725(+)
MAIAMAASMSLMRLRASWDTNPNPIPVLPNKNLKPLVSPENPQKIQKATPTRPNVSDLLNSNSTNPTKGNHDGLYLGYERWLPVAPKVKKPRSIYNATSLAYIGDCIYELYARRHFLFPPLSIDDYNDRVIAVVRCEAQDALLKKLLDDDYLSEEERDVLRWGKNISSGKTRTKKRAGVAVYNRASSLETLVGFLYLTNVKRLEDLMLKLGFSTGASTELIVEDINSR